MEIDLISVDENVVDLRLLTRNSRIVAAIRDKGVGIKYMAKEIGMSYVKLSRIINLWRPPTKDDAIKIACYLEKPVDYLFPEFLMRAIEAGVFHDRYTHLNEPQVISLTEARHSLVYDSEDEMIEEITRSELREAINKALDCLMPRERIVIELRFGLDGKGSKTLEETGRLLGVTKERIRQIEEKALRRLRHPRRSKLLLEFLE